MSTHNTYDFMDCTVCIYFIILQETLVYGILGHLQDMTQEN